jgi:hypothetical protein
MTTEAMNSKNHSVRVAMLQIVMVKADAKDRPKKEFQRGQKNERSLVRAYPLIPL